MWRFQGRGHFLADDDSAEGGGDDAVALNAAQPIGQPSANVRGDVGVLEEQRALKKIAGCAGPTAKRNGRRGARRSFGRVRANRRSLARSVARRLSAAGLAIVEGDRLDLDARIFREGGDAHRRARGWVFGEVGRVNFIHLLEVAEVGQKNRRLDDVREA